MSELTTPASLSKPEAEWQVLFRVFALVICCLAAGACAHPISFLVRAEADPNLILPRVFENPKAYLGSIVIWGGVISKVSSGAEGLKLLLIQNPLDSQGRPQTKETEGEFIARTSESPDPRAYRKGLTITLAGEIDGVEERNGIWALWNPPSRFFGSFRWTRGKRSPFFGVMGTGKEGSNTPLRPLKQLRRTPGIDYKLCYFCRSHVAGRMKKRKSG